MTERRLSKVLGLLLVGLLPPPLPGQPSLPASPMHRVLLTEVMVHPLSLPPNQGQWIEIHNPWDEAVDLQGMVLKTASGGQHPISPSQSLRLGPGEFLVLGPVLSASGDTTVQYAYGKDLPLNLEEDILWLSYQNAPVDVVSWGPGAIPIEPGHSLSREPSDPDPSRPEEWCASRQQVAEGPDFGTPGAPNGWCDGDGDGLAEDEGDCDDGNGDVHPGSPETCNGLDDNCNGWTDDGPMNPDRVCPSLGVCRGMVARCLGAGGWTCDFPSTYEPSEGRCDGLDNDCDGETDEGIFWEGQALGASCEAPGVCGPGRVVCRADGSGALCSTAPGGPNSPALPEVCNGLDDDCDGTTDNGFPVGETCVTGLGQCRATGLWRCSQDGASVVCDAAPSDPDPEVCGNGLDDDCDGETDEGFPVGETCAVGEGSCRALGKWLCSGTGLDVRCSAVPATPQPEACGNGLDDDCDGEIDEVACDGPGSGCRAGRGAGPGFPFAVLLLALPLLARRRPARQPPPGPDGAL